MFRAVLNAVQLPVRWQKRLSEAFWRPEMFRAELQRLTTAPGAAAKALPAELLAGLKAGDVSATAVAVQSYLDTRGIDVIGARTVEEMAEHLLDVAADLSAKPLDAKSAALIEAVRARARARRNQQEPTSPSCWLAPRVARARRSTLMTGAWRCSPMLAFRSTA